MIGRILFFCFVIQTSGLIFCQSFRLIKTGRPEKFEYNNALQVVGKKWDLSFEYFAFDGINFETLDSITALNQVVEDKLSQKFGNNWYEDFNQEVNQELQKQNDFRKSLAPLIVDLKQQETLKIHFQKQKCRAKKYNAFVFTQIEKEGARPFYVLRTYRISASTGKVKLTRNKLTPIHFEYKENGITMD